MKALTCRPHQDTQYPKKYMLFLHLLLSVVFFIYKPSYARDAPVTTVGSASLCQPGLFSVPLTVENFTSISSISLRVDYDPTVVSFTSFAAHSMFGTMIVNNVPVSPNLHKIMIVWSETTPINLASGTALVIFTFNYIYGNTTMILNNVSNNGNDCEYADENGNPLTDTPTESFYNSGIIQSIPAQLTLANIVIGNGQSHCYNATQSITLAGGTTSFSVKSGGVGSLTGGQRIFFLPGTEVQSGGHFFATISEQCNPCFNSFNQTLVSSSNGDHFNVDIDYPPDINGTCQPFPNPTTGRVNLKLQEIIKTITVFNRKGWILKAIVAIESNECSFAMDEFPAGIYFIMVQSVNHSYTGRLIIK